MCLGCMWILCCLCDGSRYQVDLRPNLYMYLYAYIGEWTTIDMTKKKWNQPKCPPTNQSWNGSRNVHSITFHVINNSAEICIQKGICIHMHIHILKIYYNFWLRKWSWKIHTFVKAMKPCAALIMFNP